MVKRDLAKIVFVLGEDILWRAISRSAFEGVPTNIAPGRSRKVLILRACALDLAADFVMRRAMLNFTSCLGAPGHPVAIVNVNEGP